MYHFLTYLRLKEHIVKGNLERLPNKGSLFKRHWPSSLIVKRENVEITCLDLSNWKCY